ncbi:MAG: mannose-1-phosphate guanylyltransferase/mannose-6-phosphate isomerase [Pseudomonadota bacterium]
MTTIIPVILSGGSGSRLWPASRSAYPKQLLPMVGEQTMLQDTAGRVSAVAGCSDPIIVCNNAHRFMVAEQLHHLGMQPQIILEPEGRNTAPAVALAALLAARDAKDSLLLVMPADHVIANVDAFARAVVCGIDAARAGKLVTFGVVPESPHTGYGYIKASPDGDAAVPVEAFVEKPDLDTAKAYLVSGNYLWNSGMFLLPADAFLAELERFEPQMLQACRQSMDGAAKDLDFIRPDVDAFARSPSNSIDYAVMERTDKAMVVPLEAGWSDVGSWPSLHAARGSDADGNAINGDVITADCTDSLISAESRLVAAVGLHDHVVVETTDAVMVAPKSQAENVKVLVEKLKAAQRSEVIDHRQKYRPWGSFDALDHGEGFEVKRLIVKPGAQLALQTHERRSEHWIVVRGTARITCGDKEFDVNQNESTFIPMGQKHRIANPYAEPLEIIEVQTGDYLGEDDVVRY